MILSINRERILIHFCVFVFIVVVVVVVTFFCFVFGCYYKIINK